MVKIWEAVVKYEGARSNPNTTRDDIRNAGVVLVKALRDNYRPIPDKLINEIIDGNHIDCLEMVNTD